MAWLSEWTYKKSITLSRASGAVTNYQMKLFVGESSGAIGEDVDCGGNCLSTFNDIRFTKSDGTTLLNYWIESISGTTPNQLATIWIKFDFIDTSATRFCMYYGKADATAVSNGPNTFIFHDHFDGDMSKWSGSTSNCSIASSVMTMTASSSWARIYGDTTSGFISCAIRGLINLDATYAQFGLAKTDFSSYALVSREGTSGGIFTKDLSASSVATTITKDAFKVFDIIINGGVNVKAFENGVELTGSPKTSDPPVYSDLCANFGSYNANPCIKCDWILIRQYLSTEPVWGSWVSEEIDVIYFYADINPTNISSNANIKVGYLDITDKYSEISCSSKVQVDYGPDKLFDNNSGTSWECSGPASWPEWIKIRIPFSRKPTRISITPRSGLQARAPKQFVFYGSNTGSFSGEETTLYTSGQETGWGDLEERNFDFTNTDSFIYFKLNITSSNTSTIVSMSSFKIKVNDSTELNNYPLIGPDLSEGQIYLQSSYWDSSFVSRKAFDNDSSTLWHSAGATNPPHWIQIKFDSPKRVTLITWLARLSSNWYVPIAFNIKGSNTGNFSGEETTIESFSVSSEWLVGTQKRYFYFSNENSYIYYRVTVTQSSGQNSMIAEMEFILALIKDHSVIILKYRTGATSALCEAATYQEYTAPFDSEGFVQLRVEG